MIAEEQSKTEKGDWILFSIAMLQIAAAQFPGLILLLTRGIVVWNIFNVASTSFHALVLSVG